MKKLILTLTAILLSRTAVADFAAVQTLSPAEKQAQGFEIQYTGQSSLDGFVSEAFAVEMEYGRPQAQFSLILRAIILSDLDGKPVMKLTNQKLVLSPSLSQEVYSQLAVDFTPKKIGEGVELDKAVIQCESADRCLMVDEVGDHFLISTHGGSFSEHPGKFSPYQYEHFHNPYREIPHVGAILTADNQMTPEFLKSVIKESFSRAPDFMLYENRESSGPDREKSYDEHRLEADKKQLEALGKKSLERMIVQSMITDAETTYVEKVRKSSGGSCTYFCGTSGPFIDSFMKAQVLF
ncbi:MAG: hypothetical protein HRT44_08590 [Bdellovibrionales bacterium]|nr:hypothetical protein [Bdellovibrionales bacterium]NQZ19297.1 hypothetical protein [Bdellovibrionales bacterium]